MILPEVETEVVTMVTDDWEGEHANNRSLEVWTGEQIDAANGPKPGRSREARVAPISVTLHWTAHRDHPFSPAAERSAEAIVDAASEEPNILSLMDAEGTFWEGMLLWPDPDEEGDVLRGAAVVGVGRSDPPRALLRRADCAAP